MLFIFFIVFALHSFNLFAADKETRPLCVIKKEAKCVIKKEAKIEHGLPDYITQVALSQDGTRMLTVDREGRVEGWAHSTDCPKYYTEVPKCFGKESAFTLPKQAKNEDTIQVGFCSSSDYKQNNAFMVSSDHGIDLYQWPNKLLKRFDGVLDLQKGDRVTLNEKAHQRIAIKKGGRVLVSTNIGLAGTHTFRLEAFKADMTPRCFSTDGTLLAVQEEGIPEQEIWPIAIFSLVDKKKVLGIDFSCELCPDSFAFSPDNKSLFCATNGGINQGKIFQCAVETGELISSFEKQKRRIAALVVKGKLLASGTNEGHICVWNHETGTLMLEYWTHESNEGRDERKRASLVPKAWIQDLAINNFMKLYASITSAHVDGSVNQVYFNPYLIDRKTVKDLDLV